MGFFVGTKEEKGQHKEQILRIFVPDDRLLAAQVSMRLEGVTGGRKILSDSKVISLLEELVKEKRLSRQVTKKNIQGHEVNCVQYFLPVS